MTFGEAVEAVKDGKRASRSSWNGRDMWIAYSPGNAALPSDSFWSPANQQHARELGGTARVLPCLTMRTADGSILMGWLASQTDMLADDWTVL